MTVLPVDWDKNGRLHHFILAFETIRLNADQAIDPKEQLTLYYEQLKQSILENDSYVDALLDMAGTIYTVNLTRDTLERNISPAGKSDSDRALFLDYPLPCAYRDYCDEYRKRRDVLCSVSLLGLSHSLIEDTILLALVGGSLWGLLGFRLLFTLVTGALINAFYPALERFAVSRP